jgi:hypothetical protein
MLTHGIYQFFIFKVFEAKYKKEIRLMIKQGYPEDKLVKFVFHKDIETTPIPHFKWIKPIEFRYKGEMYDIVKTERHGDSIFYTCIHDVKESNLFANLHEHIGDFLNKKPEKNNDLLALSNSLSKLYNFPQVISIKNYSLPLERKVSKSFKILERESFILVPPPKT